MGTTSVPLVVAAFALCALPSCSLLLQVDLGSNIAYKHVYRAGEDGYYCFRIPALLFTSEGTLLAFAEGRGKHTGVCSDHGDVHIVIKRSSDMGKTWSGLTIVYQENGHTIGKTSPYIHMHDLHELRLSHEYVPTVLLHLNYAIYSHLQFDCPLCDSKRQCSSSTG